MVTTGAPSWLMGVLTLDPRAQGITRNDKGKRVSLVPVSSLAGLTGTPGAIKVREASDPDPARVWRMEVAPTEAPQVDFGRGAPVVESQGRRRKQWIFSIVLSYPRYSSRRGVGSGSDDF